MTIGAVALLGFLAVGAVAFWKGQVAADEAADAEERAAAGRLVAARSNLAWVHHDLLVDGLLAELGGPAIDDARLEDFHDRRDAALDTVQELADGDSDVAIIAESLLEVYRDEPFDEWPYPADELERQHFVSLSAENGGAVFDEFPAETAAVVGTMLPSLILSDAAAVQLSQGDRPPPWAARYVRQMTEVLDTAPGWLGPNRERPFERNVLAGGPDDDRAVAGLVVDALPELRSVWDYDQWLIQRPLAAPDGPPPFRLEVLAEATRTVLTEARAEAEAGLAAIADQDVESTPGPARWYATAMVAVVGSLATVGLLVIGQRRRRKALDEALLTDHLTGARNRRYLETVVATRLGTPGRHHLVAMIDLDRFKLVNDTWGHDAGDTLLVAAAARLMAAVDELGTGRSGFAAAVVRHGGDEFIVAVHDDERFDPEAVEARLAAVAGPIDVGLDAPVPLELSVGVATTSGPVEVSDLLKPADLAAYEKKRSRRSARPLRQPPTADLSTPG